MDGFLLGCDLKWRKRRVVCGLATAERSVSEGLANRREKVSRPEQKAVHQARAGSISARSPSAGAKGGGLDSR